MAAAEPQPAPAPAEHKFSRYRSVRKAHQQHQHDPPPMPPVQADPQPAATKSPAVSRSMSRYHRQRPATTVAPGAHDHRAPPLPAGVPPVPQPTAHDQRRVRAQSNPGGPSSRQNSRPTTARANTHDVVPANDPDSPTLAREEARRMLEGESARQARAHAQLKAEKRAKLEEAQRLRTQQEAEETERRNAERVRQYQEKKAEDLRARQEAARAQAARARQEEEERQCAMDRERPHTAKSPSTEVTPLQSPLQSPPDSPNSARKKERFGFLRRRKDEQPTQSAECIAAQKPRMVSSENPDSEAFIKAGGGGVVPGIDAPISAVNAGDRRVMVECNRKKILLPVTPTTTPQELIRSAANVLSEAIDAKASVLLEFFGKVGVQRPLRNYEHVRDVLNSWDDDMQNSLILVDSPTGGNDADLKASSVPTEKPDGISCWMHYSQKPGRWSKRYITLRNDGQIVLAKNEDGKDTSNVCHMSDFDIYSPTGDSKTRKVKPPKKFCFAIKSQQKSTMFMTTSSFVHFFCSNDKNVAASFYSSVQGWRSWYLVNVMGEGQKKAKAEEQAALNTPGIRKASGNQAQVPTTAVHRPSASIDSHYQLGSFKPLLDMNQFSSPGLAPEQGSTSPADNDFGRKMSMRTREHPPPVSTTHLAPHGKAPNTASPTTLIQQIQSDDEDGTFASGGLLGRAYSQRQKALADREKALKNSGPFTEGASLLNSAPAGRVSLDNDVRPQRMASVRSNRGRQSGEFKRAPSTRRREMPKPLVDLTPQYKEPPQFSRKGKGYRPDHLGPGGLVDAATSPDVPIPIPPSQDWRARRDASGARPTTAGGPAERTKSLRGHGQKIHYIANNHANVPENGSEAFTGRGLLASATFGPTASAAPFGHGVMDGSKAKGPMLDLSEENRFAKGSLLEKVAAQQPAHPIIDRD